MSQQRTRSRRPRAMILMLVAGMLTAIVAAPASADHDRRPRHVDRPSVSFRFGFGQPGYAAPVRLTRSQVEYRQGMAAGRRAGTAQGYRHGFDGLPFCGEVPRPTHKCSKAFRKGFVAGFKCGYETGFRNGRQARWQPRWQPRCPSGW